MRACADEAEVKYAIFKEWLGDSLVDISDEMWSELMDEDASFDYQTNGTGIIQLEISEVNHLSPEHGGHDGDSHELHSP